MNRSFPATLKKREIDRRIEPFVQSRSTERRRFDENRRSSDALEIDKLFIPRRIEARIDPISFRARGRDRRQVVRRRSAVARHMGK
jgi:hypothetical protein